MRLEELQAELQEAESAWLQKMAPIWREESEEAKLGIRHSGNLANSYGKIEVVGKADFVLPSHSADQVKRKARSIDLEMQYQCQAQGDLKKVSWRKSLM